jgi:hypothetical protein
MFHSEVVVCEVSWIPERREWKIRARGCTDDGVPGAWGGIDSVPEGELAEGLGIARDIIITGG